MDENYAALFVSIYKGVPPESAFYMMRTGKQLYEHSYHFIFTEQDSEDMAKLRESKITYKEIGEMYGLKEGAVFVRIKRFKESIKKEA